MLDKNGVLKIADFGCSEVADQAGVKTIKGTPAFMAPEMLLQQRTSKSLDAFACDLYSVGSCIYMFHEGRPPYYERNEIEMVARLERGIAPSFSRNVSQDPNLLDLLHGLLQIDPSKRFTIRDVVTHAYTTEEGSHPMYENREAMEHALKRDTESRKMLDLTETEHAISMATLSYDVAIRSSDWLKRARTRIKHRLSSLSGDGLSDLAEAAASAVPVHKKGKADRRRLVKKGHQGGKFLRCLLRCFMTSSERQVLPFQPMEFTSDGNFTTERLSQLSVASKEKESSDLLEIGSYSSSSSSSDDDDEDEVLLTGQSALDTIIIRPVSSKYSVLEGIDEGCENDAFPLPSAGKPPTPGQDILELLKTSGSVRSGSKSDGSESPTSDMPPYGLFSSKTVCETNEDRACALMNRKLRMFGVFDGHNGSFVSQTLSKHLLANANKMLKSDIGPASENKESMFRELFCAEEKSLMSCLLAGFRQTSLTDTIESIDSATQSQNTNQQRDESREPDRMSIVTGLEDSVQKTLRLKRLSTKSTRSEIHGYTNLSSAPGSTATLVAILKNADDTYWMHVAWVGDSRAVLSSKDGRVVVLTEDHRASNPSEAARMRKVGGIISRGRTFGSLQLSRSFGDPAHKEHFLWEHFPSRYPSLIAELTPKARKNSQTQTRLNFLEEKKENGPCHQDAVICTPGYLLRKLTPSDEFVLVASDGFFDVMSNNEAIEATRHLIAEGLSLTEVAERLVWFAIQRGTDDNCTVVVAALQ